MKHSLVEQFNKVGLTLKLLDKPFIRGRGDIFNIFQMDIGRKVQGTRRTEWFEIYLGHENNIVQIIDVDTKLNQILLLVHEPERIFEVEERKPRNSRSVINRRNRLHETSVSFKETKHHFIILNKTPAGKRHFLMGVDERQLFVAQLRHGVSNITEARKSLGRTIMFHEGKRKMSASRQGEWFFIKATKVQEEVIELLLQKNRAFILNNENIGKHAGRPQGNPHTADELVVIPNNPETIQMAQASKYARKNKDLTRIKPLYSIREREVFVRGCIRHIDHKTIKYRNWYQVILNNEGDTASATQSWID